MHRADHRIVAWSAAGRQHHRAGFNEDAEQTFGGEPAVGGFRARRDEQPDVGCQAAALEYRGGGRHVFPHPGAAGADEGMVDGSAFDFRDVDCILDAARQRDLRLQLRDVERKVGVVTRIGIGIHGRERTLCTGFSEFENCL